MRRQRLAKGCDGGFNDLRRLAAQPAVDGADLGRLSHGLLQPAACGDVEIEVEPVEPGRRPARRGEHLGDALLLAFVIYFVVFVVPILPAMRAQYQRVRAREIADENALYCKRLNMKVGTQTYNDCLLVLGDFRLKVEQRIYNESDF